MTDTYYCWKELYEAMKKKLTDKKSTNEVGTMKKETYRQANWKTDNSSILRRECMQRKPTDWVFFPHIRGPQSQILRSTITCSLWREMPNQLVGHLSPRCASSRHS
ncbi:hypothetical protein TNCV_3286651 [Trichonephila clavipes]|nr:hypothetical protein TNCV_3286651 [Trichonephila clavipes]